LEQVWQWSTGWRPNWPRQVKQCQATPHPIVSFKFWLVFTKVILCKKCMMNFGIGMVRGVWEEVCQFSFLFFLSFFLPLFLSFLFSFLFFFLFFSPSLQQNPPPPAANVKFTKQGTLKLAPAFHMPVAHAEPETIFISLLHQLRMQNQKPSSFHCCTGCACGTGNLSDFVK